MYSTPSDPRTADSPQHPGAWGAASAPAAPPPSLAGDDTCILPGYLHVELPSPESSATNSYASSSYTPPKNITRTYPNSPGEQPQTTTNSSIPTNSAKFDHLYSLSIAAGVQARLLGLCHAINNSQPTYTQSTAPVRPHRSVFGPPEQSSDQETGLPEDSKPSTVEAPHPSVFGPAEENSDQETGVRSNGAESTAPIACKSVFGPDANGDNGSTIPGPRESQTSLSGGLIAPDPVPQPVPAVLADSLNKEVVDPVEEPTTVLDSERKTFWQRLRGWKVRAACGAWF